MVAASVMSKWTQASDAQGQLPESLLVCIYTCEAHRHLLERFYASEVGVLLRDAPGARLLEVYADATAPGSSVDGRRMVLRADERYEALSIKTHRMIEFGVRNFQFENLVKIDVTTVMTELDSPEYAERKAMDMSALAQFIRDADYSRDYNGFMLHERAGREGAENWARKKGGAIQYSRLFGEGPMPPFYSGKCYLLSRRFAEYIANSGADVADEHRLFFLGSEDVMIGRMYARFRETVAP